MSKNICQCPNPPGGQVVCEAHQIAICRVKNGVIESQCMTPSNRLDKFFMYQLDDEVNFDKNKDVLCELVYEITGERRFQDIKNFDEAMTILKEKFYEDKETNLIIKLDFPNKWKF